MTDFVVLLFFAFVFISILVIIVVICQMHIIKIMCRKDIAVSNKLSHVSYRSRGCTVGRFTSGFYESLRFEDKEANGKA